MGSLGERVILATLGVMIFLTGCATLPPEEGFGEKGTAVGQAIFTLVDSCQKELDSNSNQFVKGTLTFTKTKYGHLYTYSDKCWKGKLLEYSCKEGKQISRELIECEKGCTDGACTSPAAMPEIPAVNCTDSDGGINFTVKGTTKGVLLGTNELVEMSDSCSSQYQVAEGYCQDNQVAYFNYTFINGMIASSGTFCPQDTFCQDGACVLYTCNNSQYVCKGEMLVDCETEARINCSQEQGYLNSKVCGQKSHAFVFECQEPCTPGQEIFTCAKGSPFNPAIVMYALSKCGEYEYGGFDWISENVPSCPSGTSCGEWKKESETGMEFAVCG